MKKETLNFKLTEEKGNYGIIFQGSKPVAFAMFDKEDLSLSVAFKNGEVNKYPKSDVLLSVYDNTDRFYGFADYSVTENNNILNAHYEKYISLNN
ncbi:hypothetical protein ADIWIN_1454 [Winogradskyella psychrotolerans RS-3]|uniref:Uncharacterized protein n=1 Tax=Winogradskyella psychrotolerans RS-3 TaxID=641526 RepID=S7X318_9FLAO|nr:hypothetical protein [Winogradskyella psychrotolerans]EPR73424.1 hypothetical protein ADIWIN_1454 [Winogradskyella psychrotolerans RS-3]